MFDGKTVPENDAFAKRIAARKRVLPLSIILRARGLRVSVLPTRTGGGRSSLMFRIDIPETLLPLWASLQQMPETAISARQ